MKIAKSDKKLLDAAKNGDKKGVEAALSEGANVNFTGDYNNTALNYAADGGHTDIVILLIEKGADVNNKGGADMSPLTNAATAGHLDVSVLLLEKGAVVTNDLLSAIQLKINVFEENAHSGMVTHETVEVWKDFLENLYTSRIKQDLPEMIQSLSHESAEDRKWASEAMQNAVWRGIDISSAIPTIINLLSDEDNDVRYHAGVTLCANYIKNSSINEIGSLFTHDDNVKEGAIYAMYAFAQAGTDVSFAIDILRNILNDNDDKVRHDAAITLGHIAMNSEADVSGAIPNLIKLLSDTDPQMRADTAWTFCKIAEAGGDISTAAPSIQKLLSDEDDEVRDMAGKAMDIIKK